MEATIESQDVAFTPVGVLISRTDGVEGEDAERLAANAESLETVVVAVGEAVRKAKGNAHLSDAGRAAEIQRQVEWGEAEIANRSALIRSQLAEHVESLGSVLLTATRIPSTIPKDVAAEQLRDLWQHVRSLSTELDRELFFRENAADPMVRYVFENQPAALPFLNPETVEAIRAQQAGVDHPEVYAKYTSASKALSLIDFNVAHAREQIGRDS